MTSQIAIVDRCRCGVPEILVDPVGGQRREVVGGQLDHPLVLAPEVMRLLEKARGEDAELQVSEALGDLQRAGPGRERLVQLAEQRVDVRHERADPASAAVVVQPLGESLGLAQALQRPPDFTELVQHRPQLEADLEGLLQRGLALRQRIEDAERLLEPDPGVRERRPRGRLESGLPEIVHRLLPQLAPERRDGRAARSARRGDPGGASRSRRRSAREARGAAPAAVRRTSTSWVSACLKEYSRSGNSPVS